MVTGRLTLTDLDGKALKLDRLYRGASVFLLCGGPSASELDMSRLQRPGVMVAAINNASKALRPNIHFYCDGTHRFLRSVFVDPTVTKFVRAAKQNDQVFDSQRQVFRGKVNECPGVVLYRQRSTWDAERFLDTKFAMFGPKGGLSTFLVALRILCDLSFKRIFLLGCDFYMEPDRQYHFDQRRSDGQIKNNQRLYKALSECLGKIKPALDQAGVEVYNCNPCSMAGTFDHMAFDDALVVADNLDGIVPGCEPSGGMYDYSVKHKQRGRYQRPPPRVVAVVGLYRSGTSMVASMLAKLGAQAGQAFKGKANPRGFFEDKRLGNLLKRDLCAEPELEHQHDRTTRVAKLREWMHERVAETDDIIIAKHPLLALVLDEAIEAWSVFGDVRVVATRRDLDTSIASMIKTKWRGWNTETITYAQTMIASRVQDYVKRSGIAEVDYDWALANPMDAAKLLAGEIGVTDEDAINTAHELIAPPPPHPTPTPHHHPPRVLMKGP